jgi:hypothetical protein
MTREQADSLERLTPDFKFRGVRRMHDRNGTPLKVGDVVTIEYVITSVSPGPDYCNICAQSIESRKPDGLKEHFAGNSFVCVLSKSAP